MKNKKLLDAFENIKDEYIEEATDAVHRKSKKPKFILWAACVALAVACAAVFTFLYKPAIVPDNDTSGKTNCVSNEISTFSDTVSSTKAQVESGKEESKPIACSEPTAPRGEQPCLSIAPRVVYDGDEYIICGSAGESEILEKCAVVDTLDSDCAGNFVCRLETTDGVHWIPTREKSKTVMYEYAPQKTENVYIVCIDGTYYAAIRYDNGYCTVDGENR